MLPIHKSSYNSIPPSEDYSSWKKEATEKFFISSDLDVKRETKNLSQILLVVGLDEDTTLLVERTFFSTIKFWAINHITNIKQLLEKVNCSMFKTVSVLYNENDKKLVLSIGNTVHLYIVRTGNKKAIFKNRTLVLEDNIKDIFLYYGPNFGFWYLSDNNKLGFVELKKISGESLSKKPWRATICLRQQSDIIDSSQIIVATFSYKKDLFVITNDKFFMLRSLPTGIDAHIIPNLPAKIDQSKEEAIMARLSQNNKVISNFLLQSDKNIIVFVCIENKKMKLKKYSIKDAGCIASVTLKENMSGEIKIYNPNPGIIYLVSNDELLTIKDRTRQ